MFLRIHDKYVLRGFVRVFAASVAAFTLIYVIVNVFEEIDNFIDHEATLGMVVRYYVYTIPSILTYILPTSLMLATVFSLGVLARRNELTALIASGVSLVRVSRPILLFALGMSVFSTWFNDSVVAAANRIRLDIKHHEIEKRPRPTDEIRQNFQYLGEEGFVFLAGVFNPQIDVLYDVVVQQFDAGTLRRRIDARRAVWEDSVWVFEDGFERVFRGEVDSVRAFVRYVDPRIRERPDDFKARRIDPEEMTARELREYIRRVARSGGDVDRYRVDYFFKFSFPLAGLMFVLSGIAFAAGRRKPTVTGGFGVTLAVSFVYYVALRVGQTLGHNSVLPPFVAAESGNILFLVVGSVLVARANR